MANKKVIIVRNSESLPTDINGGRLWRTGLLAKHLSLKNYDLTWVCSSFDHYNGLNRSSVGEFEELPELRKSLVLLKTPGYSKNSSPLRFIDHLVFAVKLFFFLRKHKDVGVIFCSYPTPDSSITCLLISKLYDIPLILDIRDMWPDVFIEKASGIKKHLMQLGFSLYYFMRNICFRYADALFAVNSNFLDWARTIGKRTSNMDRVHYIPFEKPSLSLTDRNEASRLFSSRFFKNKDINIAFGGTVGYMFNFKPLAKALKRLKGQYNVNVFICGKGACLEQTKELFSEHKGVIFTNLINSKVLFALYEKVDILFAPYEMLDNFDGHLPNKFMEYCASEKPILTSLNGEARALLKDYGAGYCYDNETDILNALDDFFENPKLTETMGKGASAIYEKLFHSHKILHEMESDILNIMKSEK
ncbi:MAG: glycosyltransferase family 4 protein [Gammaproteobacteria bacterium]|nr:glycosyltransferase family 4 protein [Gammaproteobacteria bacterium]